MENLTRLGTWWLKSESKPHWNVEGRDYVGGFEICAGARLKLDEMKIKFEEEPPEDLEWGYIRD